MRSLVFRRLRGLIGIDSKSFIFFQEKICFTCACSKLTDYSNLNFLEELKEKAQNVKQRIYPSLPSPALPTTLPLSAYVGTYAHPGYQTVTVTLDEAKNTLHADRSFVTFPERLNFEHISGDYFLIRSVHDWDYGAVFPTVLTTAYAAEFRLGADGRPGELGIAWEEQMKGEKLWFKLVSSAV
jgi:Domain of unknown function (DUF3471)